MGDLKTPKFHSEINWPLIKECKLSFVQINAYIAIFCLSILILMENFYLVEKQRNENVMKFFRSFVDSDIRENMW